MAHGNLGRDAELQGAYVERRACAVGWDEAGVELDDLLHHFAEHLLRHWLHDEGFGRLFDAPSVVGHAEGAYFPVFTAENFQPFKHFLSVLEAGGGYWKRHFLRTGRFNFAPFAVAVVAAQVDVGRGVVECQRRPVYFVVHFSRSGHFIFLAIFEGMAFLLT